LLESVPMAPKILDIEAIPLLTASTMAYAAWQEELFSYITGIAENTWEPDSEKNPEEFDIPVAENTVSLKIYLVPDQNAPQFFCQASGIKGSEDDLLSSTAAGRNTLIALVEP